MIPFIKVLHTIPGVVTNEDITKYVTSLQINKGTEATKNTVNIELINPAGSVLRETTTNADDVTSKFFINDSRFSVYLDWVPITTQDPVIVATLSTDAEPVDNNGKYKFKLKCTDMTAILLNKVWAETIDESTNFNASDAIINIIGHLNDLDGTTENIMTTNNVSTTKVNGSAFPKPVTISKIWKPGYEWLNELSQIDYTGEDRPYVYWVDANNDLHWHYPYQKSDVSLTQQAGISDTTIYVTSTSTYPSSGFLNIEDEVIEYTGKTSTTFTGCTRGAKMTNASLHLVGTLVSGLILYLGRQDIYSLSIETTEDQTYNFIIYNGGPTPAGYEYLDYSLDESQVGKKFRMKFVDWKGEGKDMQNKEFARGTFTDGYPDSYPWTPFWTATAVTTDEEYQSSFETELRRRCENKAESYYVQGKQKFKASCQMKYSNEYNVNDLVTVTSPQFNKVIYARIKDIKIQVNKSGVIMDLDLEEDVSAITLGD